MIRALFLLMTLWATSLAYSQDNGIPFAINIEEITYEDWPGLHSFAFGEWDDYWVFIGGRLNGLHG